MLKAFPAYEYSPSMPAQAQARGGALAQDALSALALSEAQRTCVEHLLAAQQAQYEMHVEHRLAQLQAQFDMQLENQHAAIEARLKVEIEARLKSEIETRLQAEIEERLQTRVRHFCA